MRYPRGYIVEETSPGIYNVKGDILPIQVINSRELSLEENLWLKGLSDKLNPTTYLHVSREIYRLDKAVCVQAYLHAIAMANVRVIKEAIEMSDDALTLDEVFERTGLAARWKEKETLSIAQNMLNYGLSIETVVAVTNLDLEKVKELNQAAVNK